MRVTAQDLGARFLGRVKSLKEALVRCEKLAATQAGIISGRQAIERGLSWRGISNLVASGQWAREHPEVFRCAAHPKTWWSQVVAALLWAGPFAVISHRTAATLWQLDGVAAGPIEVSVASGQSTAGVKSYRVKSAPPYCSVRGIRATTIERTLLDLCACATPRVAGLAMDDALRRGLTTLPRLWTELSNEQRPGRRGIRQFRILLEGRDDRDGKMRSRFEAVMRGILKRISTPHEVDYPIVSGNRRRYLDFAYPHLKIGIEAQSIRWHLGTEKVKADMARHRSLVLDGWLMLYYSWDDATFRRAEVEEEIRSAIRQRSSSARLFS